MRKMFLPLMLAAVTSLNAQVGVNANNEIELMRQYFNNISQNIVSSPQYKKALSQFSSFPSTNVYNEKNGYVIELELAGMNKNDIKVTINDNRRLIVSGVKKSFIKDKNATVVSEESYFGKFRKELSLPNDADINSVNVSFTDGILTINIAKLPQKETSRVLEIK